jgi:hypothetical protein
MHAQGIYIAVGTVATRATFHCSCMTSIQCMHVISPKIANS